MEAIRKRSSRNKRGRVRNMLVELFTYAFTMFVMLMSMGGLVSMVSMLTSNIYVVIMACIIYGAIMMPTTMITISLERELLKR